MLIVPNGATIRDVALFSCFQLKFKLEIVVTLTGAMGSMHLFFFLYVPSLLWEPEGNQPALPSSLQPSTSLIPKKSLLSYYPFGTHYDLASLSHFVPYPRVIHIIWS